MPFPVSELATGAAGSGLTLLVVYVTHRLERSRNTERFRQEEEAAAKRFERERKERDNGFIRAQLHQLYEAVTSLRGAAEHDFSATMMKVQGAERGGHVYGLSLDEIERLTTLYLPGPGDACKDLIDAVAQFEAREQAILERQQAIDKEEVKALHEAFGRLRAAIMALRRQVADEVRRIFSLEQEKPVGRAT